MQNVEEKKKEKIAEMSLSLWARHVEGEEIQLTALHVDLVANTFTSKNSIIEIISKIVREYPPLYLSWHWFGQNFQIKEFQYRNHFQNKERENPQRNFLW